MRQLFTEYCNLQEENERLRKEIATLRAYNRYLEAIQANNILTEEEIQELKGKWSDHARS